MKWFGGKADVAKGEHQLAKTELFRDLKKRDFRVIDAFIQERHFMAGEVIFDAGEEGQALYVIVSGKVAICLPERFETPLAELESSLAVVDRTTPITVRADKDIALQLFVDVYEAIKRLGFTTLSLQTEQHQ